MEQDTSWVGRRLSHYTLLEEIHSGELPSLFRARDDKLNREVALKVLPLDRVGDPEKRNRFIREAKAAAALEHPHVAVIHEIDEVEGVAFIAMELLDGPSLAARMEKGGLAVDEALELATGIAAGLAYAHERGVVHRDVKPENVMLTAQGYPKLIDFGIAKLLDSEKSPFLSRAGENEGALQSTTREEILAGTVSYMSPEQARGGKVDPRSDVFSFGVLLYHMLSGRAPFEGPSRLDTLHAILRQPAPRLAGLGGEERQVLEPIVQRCLAKEPDLRYANLGDVLSDLRQARLRLESGGSRRARMLRWAAGAVAIGVALVLAVYLGRTPEPRTPAAEQRPSIAVLHFENLSGDPELDWLRTGLTEMLVTDLSQSPEIEVLTTERLYQILEDMERSFGAPLPPDDVAELARRAGTETVLRGSFAKAGDSIRISARLQAAETGTVMLSEKAEGQGEESVFRLVDSITRSIRDHLEIRAGPEELDRDLRDVTTASVESYRHYAEGIRLHERFREEEAIPHFQRAIELDSGFAMALAKMGVVHSNLGLHELADEYAERALQHVDRLTERERYYIEGWCYSRRPETLANAIDSYREAIELYPDHGSARHNLGILLLNVERYPEALEQLEELRRRGMTFPATYEILASAYLSLGNVERAREVLEGFIDRNPDVWATLVALAQLEIRTGEYQRGLELLERARALGAGPFHTAPVKWEAEVFRERWSEARQTAQVLLDADGPVERSMGGHLFAVTALYQGEIDSVLGALGRLAADDVHAYEDKPRFFRSRILLEIGANAEALEEALAIAPESDEHDPSPESLVIAAIASARLGDLESAAELAERYRGTIEDAVGPAPERFYHFLLGEIALARGEAEAAVAHLNEAESMLPPRGAQGVHTVIWYSLATAHRRAGNTGAAIRWYERILDAREERLYEPIRYVRSFYDLGVLYDEEGREQDARARYRRFLEHWEGGQIDGERVRRAASRLR